MFTRYLGMEKDFSSDSTADVASLKAASVLANDARLLRKIDLKVIPVLCLLYTLAFLDR